MSRWSMRRCRACCPSSTKSASGRRCVPGLALTHRSICARCSTAKTISIRICRKAIRSASTSRRSWARARSSSNWLRRERQVGIERLHLEQDAGKSLHDQSATMSFVDLNRSGVALMEIVSKPDIRSSEQARAYVSKLRSILRYLGTCDGDMEKGSLRADVNVAVRRPGEAARHPLRDQEHELDQLHRPGDRI